MAYRPNGGELQLRAGEAGRIFAVRNKMMVDPQRVWGNYLAVFSGENQKGGNYEPDSHDVGKTQWLAGRMEGASS